jgi:hypothetical protein
MTWDSVFILLRLEDLLRVLVRGVFYFSKYACIVAVESCPLLVPFDRRAYSEWVGGDCDFLSGAGASFRFDLRSEAPAVADDVRLCLDYEEGIINLIDYIPHYIVLFNYYS